MSDLARSPPSDRRVVATLKLGVSYSRAPGHSPVIPERWHCQEAREPHDRWTGYSALAAFHSAPGPSRTTRLPGGPPPFPTLELSSFGA